MLCGCSLTHVSDDTFVCVKHGIEHVCGSRCDLKTVQGKGQLVCPVTSRVLGRVDADSTGIRSYASSSKRPTKKRKNLNSMVVKTKPRVLPDITVLPVDESVIQRRQQQQQQQGTKSSRSRRATRCEEPLSKFIGVLRKLLSGKKRSTLVNTNRKRRIDAMLEAGKTYLRNGQRNGKPLALVDVMAKMESVIPTTDCYRFVGVPGPLLDDMIFFLATYIQGAYRIVAKLRDQLQNYSQLPDSQRTHGITRGQGSRATVKMNVHTFTVQLVKIMGRGGMLSLEDERVLVPAVPFCNLVMPIPGQMTKVIDKTTRFKLKPLLRQADQIPNDLVGDPCLSFARAISSYAPLVVENTSSVVYTASVMRMPFEMGPFGIYGSAEHQPVIVSHSMANVLNLEARKEDFRLWEDAWKHSTQ